jgi:phosphohistidine phosphatase
MQIYILRHGIAEDEASSGQDADRELTSEGRKKLREVLRVAERANVSPSLIVTSPLVRAVQTAEVAVEVLGYREVLVRTEALTPSSSPEAVWEEIRNHRGVQQLMLVGHEPLLSQLVAYLLGAPSLAVEMKKAGLARIDMEGFSSQPRGVLKWLLVPKLAS